MHDNGVDADGLKEYDVARHPIADVRVRGVHETAAVFDHERLTAKALDVRQRLEQRCSFRNQILHPRDETTFCRRLQRRTCVLPAERLCERNVSMEATLRSELISPED